MISQEISRVMVSIRSVRRVCAAALVLPALDHLISPSLTMLFAPAIMSIMFGDSGAVPATIFFVVLGAFQLSCIVVVLKRSNRSLLALGVIGNLVSIVIYAVSSGGVTLPFGVPPQPFTFFGALIKVLEAVFVSASLYLLRVLLEPAFQRDELERRSPSSVSDRRK